MRKKAKNKKVDDMISAIEGGWEFTNELAFTDKYRRKPT